MIEITQGESRLIYIDLYQDDQPLKPDMVRDLTICIGDYHATMLGGGVGYDDQTMQWWIWPSTQETKAMDPGREDLCVHVDFGGGFVGPETVLARVTIRESRCEGGW